MSFYGLTDKEWGQYLQEGKTLPEIVAERPEAVLNEQQVKEMLDGTAQPQAEAGELEAGS